jgi:hypothetical protein
MRALRKTEPDRLLDSLGDSLMVLSGSVNRRKLVKAGLIAGGLAAATAGSAAISSFRHRREENDS